MVDTITNTLVYDGLVIGDYPAITETGTILSGQNLTRGTVIGKVTASGKYIACDHTASDGSEVPRGVMAADCDASAADTTGIFYVSGQFDDGKLTFGGSSAIADLKQAMKDVNLYTKTAVDME